MAGTGSTAPDEVVPTVAATKQGTRPASRSAVITAASAPASMAKSSPTSIIRNAWSPKPAIRTAFSIEEWAWLEV